MTKEIIPFEKAAVDLMELTPDEQEEHHIVSNHFGELIFYFEGHLISCKTNAEKGLVSPKEISFDVLAKAVLDKYNIDITLPSDELSRVTMEEINKIGFECFATHEMRRIANFVIDHRESILERDREEELDTLIEEAFTAIERLSAFDSSNKWYLLCNDEIMDRAGYQKAKRLGTKD